MQVNNVKGNDVVCVVKNSATLAGSLFTLHASQIRIELPTLSDKDKQVCVGQKGDVCFVVSLSGALVKGFFKIVCLVLLVILLFYFSLSALGVFKTKLIFYHYLTPAMQRMFVR